MAYPKLNIPKLSDVIVEQLENASWTACSSRETACRRNGSWPRNSACPSLAARGDSATGVARPAQQPPGRRHLGDGPAGDRLFRPLGKLLNQHQDLHGDLLEFRRVLEGAAARGAATRATPADLLRLEHCVDQLQNAYDGGDLAQQAQADVRFHQAVAEASHNVLFAHLSGACWPCCTGTSGQYRRLVRGGRSGGRTARAAFGHLGGYSRQTAGRRATGGGNPSGLRRHHAAHAAAAGRARCQGAATLGTAGPALSEKSKPRPTALRTCS